MTRTRQLMAFAALALLVLLSTPLICDTAVADIPGCPARCIDVNTCGSILEPACVMTACTYLSDLPAVEIDCCAAGKVYWRHKTFYDCNSDQIADCELRKCYGNNDPTCPDGEDPGCPN